MPPLEEFIQKYRRLVRFIVYKSKFKPKLDENDINELVYMGLWKAYRNYDPAKSSIPTFISLVITHYILDIVRSKRIYQSRNLSLENYSGHYYDEVDPSENFTEEEWKLVEPLVKNHTIQDSAASLGMTSQKYRRTTISLHNKLRRRIRK